MKIGIVWSRSLQVDLKKYLPLEFLPDYKLHGKKAPLERIDLHFL